MKIECILKRSGGSDIDVDGVIYKFRKNDKDQHVCDVDNKTHANILLAIKEGYKIPGSPDPVVENPVEEIAEVLGEEHHYPDDELDNDSPYSGELDQALSENEDDEPNNVDIMARMVDEFGIIDPTSAKELQSYADEHFGLKLGRTKDINILSRKIIEAHEAKQSAE